MFKRCLLGSIVLHIAVIAGVSFSLPASPVGPEKIAYFQLVADPGGASKREGRGSLEAAILKGMKSAEKAPLVPSGGDGPAEIDTVAVSKTVETGNILAENVKEGITPPRDFSFSQTGTDSGENPGIYRGPSTDSGPGSGISGTGGSGSPGNLQLLVPPRRIFAPEPEYPLAAKRNNWQGVVILRALIKKDGTIGEISVFQSSGHEALDRSALQTVKSKWRYQPALRWGEPVECYHRIPVRFKLEE